MGGSGMALSVVPNLADQSLPVSAGRWAASLREWIRPPWCLAMATVWFRNHFIVSSGATLFLLPKGVWVSRYVWSGDASMGRNRPSPL